MVKSELRLQRYLVMEALGNILTAASELCAAAHAATAEPVPIPIGKRRRLDRARLSW